MVRDVSSEEPENDWQSVLSSSNVALTAGTCLRDRYRVDEILGEGGMGRVYRGWDIELSRKVAIKQLILQIDTDNTEAIERFRREYYFLNSIDHPNLIKAYDLFNWEGQLFIILEFVMGIPLKQLIQEKPYSLSLLEQIAVANQLARAVQVLNTAGILHRDIKPGNVVMNSETGKISLLDLGLGKSVGKEDWALTQKGAVVGTLEYLSPEQANGSVSSQTDVFSMGVTLYQFFLWVPSSPFKSHGGVATIMEITTKDLPPLLDQIQAKSAERKIELSKAQKDMYTAISHLLSKTLEKEPEKRPTAGEVADELERIYNQESNIEKIPDKNFKDSNWKVSIRVEGKELEQLKKLGEKYGKERAISKRAVKRVSKRVSKAPKKNISKIDKSPVGLVILIMFLMLVGVVGGAYLLILKKDRESKQMSQNVPTPEEKVKALEEQVNSLEKQLEKEHEEMQRLHEQFLHLINYKDWGQFYYERALFYQKLNRTAEAIKDYKNAKKYAANDAQAQQYIKKLEELQKK